MARKRKTIYREEICEICGKLFQRSLKSKAKNKTCSLGCLNTIMPKTKKGRQGKELTDYFWSKVNKEPGQGPNGDCWEWTASRNAWGYGQFWINHLGRCTQAHRVSYTIVFLNLEWSLTNLDVICHKCDNPPCVNPAHLLKGTARDNVADRVAKGRTSSLAGLANKHSKLRKEDVEFIRSSLLTNKELSKLFNTSSTTIIRARYGHQYQDVDNPNKLVDTLYTNQRRPSRIKINAKGYTPKEFFDLLSPSRPDGECWEWQGRVTNTGYGVVRDTSQKQDVGAHRLAFVLYKNDGKQIDKGLNICHSCDNPSCVNPDHLFAGTFAENMTNKHKKGRQGRAGPKLSIEKVKQIKALLSTHTISSIAEMFGVHPVSINKIKQGKTWKNI